MKTVLYMSLTANGYFAQSDATHPVPQEILGDFIQMVGKVGNLVNGRRTFEQLLKAGGRSAIPKIDLVVVSRSSFQSPGVTAVPSPREALQYLEQKGFDTALVGGGAELDSCCLSQDLIDEIYLNIEPTMTHKGITLTLEDRPDTKLQLIETTKLSPQTLQLHYSTQREQSRL